MGATPSPAERAARTVPRTMRAVVLSGKGFENLACRDVPVPRPGPGQLLCRVDAAGVCTSILKLLAQGSDHTFLNGWDPAAFPLIIGDEGSLTVVEAGSDLSGRYHPGQRFAVQPAVDVAPINCRERYRNDGQGMSKCAVGYTLGGTLAEYLLVQEEVLRAECLIPLPDPALPFFAVSMGEPVSCVYSAQERHVHLLKDGPHGARRAEIGLLRGGVTVVGGAGAMGRMHAELALRFSPRDLIVSDFRVDRLDIVAATLRTRADSAGCRLHCVTPDMLEETLRRVSGGRGADDFILALGVRDAQQHALGLLAPGGVADLFGGLPKGEHILELDTLAVHYREIRVVGSSGGEPSDMAATLKAFARGEIDAGNYVCGIGSLEHVPDVLRMIRDYKVDGRVIVYPSVRSAELLRVDGWSAAQEREYLGRAAPAGSAPPMA